MLGGLIIRLSVALVFGSIALVAAIIVFPVYLCTNKFSLNNTFF